MAEGQGRSSGQGVKLLYIRDYLYTYTDKEHPKNAKDIKEFLASKGIKASEKTIYNDIFLLQKDFGVPIEYNPKKWGYYITKPIFEPYELRLMVDCVQAATFITDKEAYDISNKIKGLSTIYDRENLNRQVYVKDRIHRVTDSVVRNADKIHQAIAMNRKISFRYFKYVPERSVRKRYYVPDNAEKFVVSPRRLVWNNGRYYLEVYKNETFSHKEYDVECMSDIQILSSTCDTTETDSLVDEKEKVKIMNQIFGEQRLVTIRFRNECAWDVFEYFGCEIVTVPVDEYHFTISIREKCGDELYMWLSTFGCYAKILSPEIAVDGYKSYLEDQMLLYEKDIEPYSILSQEELQQI